MSQEELILNELAETRRELTQVKALLLAMAGKKPRKPPFNNPKSVNEYKEAFISNHLKKKIK